MRPYNEVNPTGLGQKEPKKRKTEVQNGNKNSSGPQNEANWPQSLLDFVNKSFQQAELLDAAQRTIFNDQIQQLIYVAAKEKKIWSNPWHLQRLPIFDASAPLQLVQDAPEIAPSQSFGTGLLPKKSKKFDSNERKNQRSARFGSPDIATKPQPIVDPRKPIRGTLEALEKRYLRLTSAPDPSTVRPQSVLELSLKFVVDNYRNSNKQYNYINDQLKAIRQDLTVQHIKNTFAIKVYEVHGRIAIENSDLGEFNQCLSQLRNLYNSSKEEELYMQTYEFQCYSVLYFLITGNNAGINSIHIELLARDAATDVNRLAKKYQRHRECLYKVIGFQQLLIEGNYHKFFQEFRYFLTANIPCAVLLIQNFILTKERLIAMNTMSKAYKKLPREYILLELAFEDVAQYTEFCKNFELEQFDTGTEFDLGSARAKLQAIIDQGRFKKVDIKGQV
ncbi:hypothetical protein PUMCH_002436 [Australozyma saopauloensis]|uniref:SAC3/GANP/THP3 conserved domain-containing protein n=1 Tax=Australozyma saopauloensis TaxID=291208 RepID=A0AAX4H993_9ASCO|nr:hypothetical protein PUMCH_002436 [[Candida] saopauloensis]